MPIKVLKQAPQSLKVLWKEVTVGDVYHSGSVLVLAVASVTNINHPRAVALEVSDSVAIKIGDVWNPGEDSEWTPMLATMTVAVKYEMVLTL